MGIVDEDIARVRETSDIVAVIGEHVALKRVGRRWSGLCPFHGEKTASFSVNQEQGLYYCFGCGAKGDVITFVREIDHLDFVGAIEKLAAKAGVTLRYTDHQEGEGRKRRKRLLEAVEVAVEWYHQRLLSAPDAAKARAYLRSRGLSGDEVRQYRIGWAPRGWDHLSKALKLPDDVFVEAGLGFLNRRNRPTDAFRGRVLFPIFDVNGDAVGFGGRILPGEDGPKYKNSSESAVYSKSRVLYGLNWAKADIVAADEVIVCEGYTDVIGFARAGINRAVATCGTALTDEHVRILRSFARRVVLAFDADAAGQNAAERFYAWEKAYDVDVAVAALEPGVDPADLSLSNPEALRASVGDSVPFLGFRVNRVLAAGDFSTPEGRTRAAESAMAVVAEHPNVLVRDQYRLEVASRCRMDPTHLSATQTRATQATLRTPARSHFRRDTPEVEALRLMIAEPDGIAEHLNDVLFNDDLTLAAYRALAGATSVRDALDCADPGARELLQRLAVEDTEAEPSDVLARLVEEAVGRELTAIESQVRTASVEDFARHAQVTAWLKLRMEELRDPVSSVTATDQLLAWLVEGSGEPE